MAARWSLARARHFSTRHPAFPAQSLWSTQSLQPVANGEAEPVTLAQVEAMAKLAAIALDDADTALVHRDVSQLLAFARAVQGADTSSVEIDPAPLSVATCPTRADEAHPVPAAQALGGAAVTVGSYFAAPKGRAFVNMDGGEP